MKLFAVAALIAAADGGAVELSKDTFDSAVTKSGKSAFVKFFAPWCGHCKRMKPDWDKLGDAYSGHNSVVIGDVDCTQHKDLCSQFDVKGYPTLKYFTKSTGAKGEGYKGGRGFDQLKKFVEDKLEKAGGTEL
mmetsp:Transcript_92923/g.248657  ORF Transcript_92923/g.248657 Transcript_92923/m.248657 type:complete len:133 (-) Transcript_92923:58-456(-)